MKISVIVNYSTLLPDTQKKQFKLKQDVIFIYRLLVNILPLIISYTFQYFFLINLLIYVYPRNKCIDHPAALPFNFIFQLTKWKWL